MPLLLPKKQTGFSLIELVTVLLIITVLTTIAIRSTVDIGYSARFEQTQNRLKNIRKAIVGDPTRSINGQPDIFGFVADMGRLPINLRELISSDPFCIDPDYGDDVSVFADFTACNTVNGYPWHIITIAENNPPQTSEGSLKSGWRGPYLHVNDAPTNITDDILPDGWGNQANSIAAYEHFYDYGWYWCHWDITDDVDGNKLPDDTDGTPDGFPNCNVSTIAALDQLSIYSLGINGLGDVNPDGSVTCGSNEYNGDCYTTILKENYIIDISSGISVGILKNRNINGGTCNFSSGVATAHAAEEKNCLNAGGSSAPSCQYTSTSCMATTPSGTWNSATSFCGFDVSSCSGPGKTWDPGPPDDSGTNTCHITQTQCSVDGGAWTGRIPCSFTPMLCSAVGTWNPETQSCTFNSASCTGSGGTWDVSTSSCDFTPSACAAATGSWGCNINSKSCYASGGLWRECQLVSTDCTNSGGSPNSEQCDFSRLSCINANGSWNSNSRMCGFTSSTCPAGSTWNGSNCDFIGNQCELAGGNIKNFCNFSSANCISAGGNFDSVTNLCSFTSSACASINGLSLTQGCAMTHREGENFGPEFYPTNCEANNGMWYDNTKTICMNIFYRQASDSTIVNTSSNPVEILENGSYQSINFANFGFSNIPIGINAIGIYEYDGDCNTDNNFYPNYRTEPMRVMFVPNNELPIINW